MVEQVGQCFRSEKRVQQSECHTPWSCDWPEFSASAGWPLFSYRFSLNLKLFPSANESGGYGMLVGPHATESERAEFAQLDVTSEQAWQDFIAGVVERHGRVDVLVNNAGLGLTKPIVETTDDEWSSRLDVNLGGASITGGLRVQNLGATIEEGGLVVLDDHADTDTVTFPPTPTGRRSSSHR